MIEEKADIWAKYEAGDWIVIPTNGDTNRWGLAVMGRGLAYDAKKRIPGMTYGLAQQLILHGNHVFQFEDLHLFTFPVKHHYYEKADLELIKRSAQELKLRMMLRHKQIDVVYLPRVGCGNGRLDWKDVKPVLESILTEPKFMVVSNQ